MSRSKHKHQLTPAVVDPPSKTRIWKIAAGVVAILVMAAIAGIWFHENRSAQTDSMKLIGNWGRTDGDYMIRILGLGHDGQARAEYFNPNPIHVATANVSEQNNKVKLFIELQDTGYPGCKYNLMYNPQQDILTGIYYQAAIQQNFDVAFVRIKNP